jgi:multiple sugar transport system substrate-binding protein
VDASKWYPPTFDAWKDDKGKLFGFGHGIYTEAIYYNKDLFEKAGLTPPSSVWDQSWTWEEMADYARKLTQGEGATKQYGLFVEPQLGWMTPIFNSFCGSIGVPDGSKLNMDSEGSVAALKFLTDLMWKDNTTPRSEVTGATSAYELFTTGRLAMFWDGSWMMPGFANDIKDFKWGVLPLPKGKCGTYTGYWVDAYAIPAASKNPDAAFEFMKFMVDDAASNAYVDQGLFGIPGKISVAEARANDLFKPLSTEEAKVWLESANYGATPEYTLNWNEVWDSTNKIIQRIQLGEITAEEAGKLMVEEADRIIAAAQQ